MNSTNYHLAQINIARLRAPLDDPLVAGFVARLEEINALADASPGFIWRLQTEAGNAAYLRPYDDERVVVNMSVWASVGQLKEYVYKGMHAEAMKHRREWFERFEGSYMALWWVQRGHIPDVLEAKARLRYLEKYGETRHAFTFRRVFAPPEQAAEEFFEGRLSPCSAA